MVLLNLIDFQLNDFVEWGRAVDVVCLDISTAFDIHSCNIVIDWPMKYRLNKRTLRQTKNWLNCWADSV